MGEEPPQATPLELLYLEAFAYLSNGMGGIDWAGLPIVAETLGLSDTEALMHALKTIKTYAPPKEEP